MGRRGLSLVELFIAITIVAILAGVAIPLVGEYYRAYKYNEYVLQVESTIKWARLIAMERGINVGICVQSNMLTLHDMGTRRSGICNGDGMRKVEIMDNFVQLNATGGGSAFDPRGFAIFSSTVFVRRTDTERCECYTLQPLRGLIRRGTCTGTNCQ
ncbi:MAG: prepilin-type N-terminal cleavage/methylation domain-containing protein [Aquificaceae bacterium]|jgi:prepilin-type N-terminal cleavage/methylation domain-containing protein|uniref:pilus assembly FimT family protein n=1 Tax=Hydrogenobacter sp. Uz 6-8 TaxID=3384828 RepID=UPI0030A8A03E